jgi:hypothetical protein
MFPAVVAAKLNIAIGACGCASGWVDWADYWFGFFPLGSGVKASSEAWQIGGKNGELIYLTLDDYNNGLWCAPSRDLFD